MNVAVWPLALVDEAVRGGARRVRRRKSPVPSSAKPTTDAALVPIVLVHGYFHNSSGLLYMQRSLRRQGFKHVHVFSYNPLRKSISDMAECLADRVEHVRQSTGSRKIHLVGHSLGGLICRYYIEQMGGHRAVHTMVAVGTPHSGTYLAYAGRSQAARQMRPDSEFIGNMKTTARPKTVRYISYYSNLDAVVAADSAILNGRGPKARNILVHDRGHLSLLISPELISSVGEYLSDI